MRKDPALLSVLASAIEQIANEALKYDPGSKHKLTTLEGERLALIVNDHNLVIRINIDQAQISFSFIDLTLFDSQESSIILKGELHDFVALLHSKSHSLADSGVDAQGNIGTLETLKELFSTIDIDWQDALQQKLGPAALPINKLISNIANYLRQTSTENLDAVKHYFQHEFELAIHSGEFSEFKNNVSTLRQTTDRIEARIQHLMRHPTLRNETPTTQNNQDK